MGAPGLIDGTLTCGAAGGCAAAVCFDVAGCCVAAARFDVAGCFVAARRFAGTFRFGVAGRFGAAVTFGAATEGVVDLRVREAALRGGRFDDWEADLGFDDVGRGVAVRILVLTAAF